MRDELDNKTARKGRHGGAGSRERRRARRAIQTIAIERQGEWATRAIHPDRDTRPAFTARIADLTIELDETYSARRTNDDDEGVAK